MGWGWNDEWQQLLWTPDEEEPAVLAEDVLRRSRLPVVLSQSGQVPEATQPSPPASVATATPTAEDWFTNPETFRRNMLLKFPFTNEAIGALRDVPLRWMNQIELQKGDALGRYFSPSETYPIGDISLAIPSEQTALHEMAHAYDVGRGDENITSTSDPFRNVIAEIIARPQSVVGQTGRPSAYENDPAYRDKPTEIMARLAAEMPESGMLYPASVTEVMAPLLRNEQVPMRSYSEYTGPWSGGRSVMPSSTLWHGQGPETPMSIEEYARLEQLLGTRPPPWSSIIDRLRGLFPTPRSGPR